MVEGQQAVLADALLVGAQVRDDLGRVARDAQRSADHQERQDQQEPPGAVHRVQADRHEQFRPEGAELVDVVAKFVPRIVRMANDGSRED